MNPSSSSLSPANKGKSEYAFMVMLFVVLVVPNLLTYYFQGPVMGWLGFHGGGPVKDALWQAITRDFAKGICALGAMVLILGAAGALRRWRPAQGATLSWLPEVFACIYYGGNIVQSWIIYQSCPGLLHGQRTTSRWPTLDSYMQDAAIDWAQTLFLIIPTVVFVLSVLPAYRRERSGR